MAGAGGAHASAGAGVRTGPAAQASAGPSAPVTAAISAGATNGLVRYVAPSSRPRGDVRGQDAGAEEDRGQLLQPVDLAQRDEQLQAAHPGHHDVEDREVRRAAFLHERERAGAVARREDLMAGLAQAKVDETAEIAVIVDDEDVSHRASPRRRATGGRRARR